MRLHGPAPPLWFDNDGCTCAPDCWRGIDLQPACLWHDWHYSEWVDCYRWQADAWFYLNLRTLGMPRLPAFGYFVAVRLFGGWVGRLTGSRKIWRKYARQDDGAKFRKDEAR